MFQFNEFLSMDEKEMRQCSGGIELRWIIVRKKDGSCELVVLYS